MHKKSPLNYTGGKYKLLPQLESLFPSRAEMFVDLFCGGLNVSLNFNAENYVANDISTPIIDLYKSLQLNEKEVIINQINEIINKYDISKTNEEGYLALRKDYNLDHEPLKLMVLISNSFNHQIRFNSKNEFNMPFGKNRSYFNNSILKNLIHLIDFLHEKKIKLLNKDFRDFIFHGTEFIYCDPPYQNSTAVYNSGWTYKDDEDLLELLDQAHKKGCRFALSCVLLHNGVENTIIKQWARKYTINEIDWKYTNSSYHKKDRSLGVEVCITNH